MDMNQILAVFTSLQNNNMSATPNDVEKGKRVTTEGFLGDITRKGAIRRLLRTHGYENFVKTVNGLTAQVMMDAAKSQFIIRVSKNNTPVKKFHASNEQELLDAVQDADHLLNASAVSESKDAESICNNCTADGVVPCQACKGSGGNCKECHGEGEVTCKKCNGQGYCKQEKTMKKIREDFGGIPTETTDEYNDNITVTTHFDKASGVQTASVSALNAGSDELMDILKNSGLIPSFHKNAGPEVSSIAPAEPTPNMNFGDDMAQHISLASDYGDDEYGDDLGGADNFLGSDDLMGGDEFGAMTESIMDWEDEDNLGYGDKEDTRAHANDCVICDEPLDETAMALHMNVHADCAKNADDKESSWDDEDGSDYEFGECMRCGDDNAGDDGLCDSCEHETETHFTESLKLHEALTPTRGAGINGAPKAWANEPNEQIAGWAALIQDADGPNNPKDMFNPVKGSDNIMTVAANKKDEKLHESGSLAEKLQNKFNALKEADESGFKKADSDGWCVCKGCNNKGCKACKSQGGKWNKKKKSVKEATTKFLNQIDASDCLKGLTKCKSEKMPGVKKEKKEVVESYGDNDFTPAGEAVLRRINYSIKHDGNRIFLKVSPDTLYDVIHSVTDHLTDLEEIGTSDVSIWVNQVIHELEDQLGV